MKRVMNVQFSGDYREAYRRMAAGQGETYFGHRYILRGMAGLGRGVGEVAMFCAITEAAYDERPTDCLRLMGGGLTSFDTEAVIDAIEAYAPTHLVLHTPYGRVATWAVANGIRTMLMLADSFNGTRIRDRVRYFQLARALNRPGVEWIANHGLKSCLSLQAIGVDPAKIVPWDYVYRTSPESHAPRELDGRPDPVELTYVGSIHESKGCGDAIRAVNRLKARNLKARLRIAGSGDVEEMQALAGRLGLDREVVFVGRIANERVVEFFREGHIALITSRHAYPEGFPLTIYEALTSRTPIVASDHLMFTGNLVDRESALIFEAGNDASLSDRIVELISDPGLYARLSRNAARTWQALQLPAKWVDVIATWARDGDADRPWLRDHAMSAPLSRERLEALRASTGRRVPPRATAAIRQHADEEPVP